MCQEQYKNLIHIILLNHLNKTIINPHFANKDTDALKKLNNFPKTHILKWQHQEKNPVFVRLQSLCHVNTQMRFAKQRIPLLVVYGENEVYCH